MINPNIRTLFINMLLTFIGLFAITVALIIYVCRFTTTDKVDGTVLCTYGVTCYTDNCMRETLHIKVAYAYDQKSYILDDSISDKMAREIEQHIEVYVNRKHPEKAYIYDSMPIYLSCIFIVLFLLFFISSAKTFIRAARHEYSEIKMRELVDEYNNKSPQ